MKCPRGLSLIAALLAGFVVMQALPLTASAAEDENKQKGWFFEMGIGAIRDRNELATGVDTGGSPYLKRGYLGYAMSRFFGAEAGFVNSDTITYTRGIGVEDKYSAQGFHGKVFVTVPFQRDNDGFYGVTFTGGGWRWDATAQDSLGNKFHSTGIAPTGSVGLIFAGRSSTLKLEYERFILKPNVPAGDFTTSGNVSLKYDVVSINFQFFL